MYHPNMHTRLISILILTNALQPPFLETHFQNNLLLLLLSQPLHHHLILRHIRRCGRKKAI